MFLGALAGSVLLSAPPNAAAQQPGKVYRIGVINENPNPTPVGQGPFYDRMRELGWVYGRDIVTERRVFADQLERIPDLATELLRWGADVFIVTGIPQAQRVQRVTRTIPIVSWTAGDLVASGLVASLTRPGGNVTGIQNLTVDLPGKHLSLLKEIMPRLSRAGILRSESDYPQGVFDAYLREAEKSAKALGIRLQIPAVRSDADFEAAFAAFRHDGAQAILVLRSPVVVTRLEMIADLALKHRLAAICDAYIAERGGLMSYGVDQTEISRSLAEIIDKLFRGAKASELPVRQPTTFWLVINLKTANALGLTIPPSLLQRADQVIE
jgi:putative ABC transport system substrate-binding protein